MQAKDKEWFWCGFFGNIFSLNGEENFFGGEKELLWREGCSLVV